MTVDAENLRLVLGLKLKSLRQDRGLSLTGLAKAAELSVSYLSEIEKGRKYPKPDKLIGLASALGISYDELVSQRVQPALDPIKEVLGSRFLSEFPFRLFGLEPGDLLDLVTDDPVKAGALFRTFLEVGHLYDVHVEQLLFAALRSYQEMHGNHFGELERAAADFRAELGLEPEQKVAAAPLREMLERDYGYSIDERTLPADPELSRFRWVFVAGERPRFFVNGNLLPAQRAFVYAYELGYRRLGLPKRTFPASAWLRVDSFEQVLANFQASYFAGAVIIERQSLLSGLEELFARRRWSPKAAVRLMRSFDATPEMFGYRLTQVIPHYLGLKDLFFLRLNHHRERGVFELTKVLNLSRRPLPFLAGAAEHHCRRWPGFRLLAGPDRAPRQESPLIEARRCHFTTDGSEHLMISMSRRLALSETTDSAVTIALRLTPEARRRLAFHDDPAIPVDEVGSTCERCPLSDCEERAAPATVLDGSRRDERRAERLRSFLAEQGDTGS